MTRVYELCVCDRVCIFFFPDFELPLHSDGRIYFILFAYRHSSMCVLSYGKWIVHSRVILYRHTMDNVRMYLLPSVNKFTNASVAHMPVKYYTFVVASQRVIYYYYLLKMKSTYTHLHTHTHAITITSTYDEKENERHCPCLEWMNVECVLWLLNRIRRNYDRKWHTRMRNEQKNIYISARRTHSNTFEITLFVFRRSSKRKSKQNSKKKKEHTHTVLLFFLFSPTQREIVDRILSIFWSAKEL